MPMENTVKRIRFCLPVAFLLAAVMPLLSQTNNEIFEKMVGPQIKMDPAIVAQVLKAGPGKKFRIDTDGDGRIDTIYFIDEDSRHSGKRKPMVVKMVDTEGNRDLNEGDFANVLYVVDWYGDGTIDRVIEYIDRDHDGSPEEQVLYQWADYPHFKKVAPHVYNDRAYVAAWTRNIGKDSRLWYDVDYEYNQELTQWKSNFNGDEIFVFCFFYDFGDNRFYPGFENPFTFYDLDGDGVSEEVVRFIASGSTAENLRYSMDIGDNANAQMRHSYDFSITALGPVEIPSSVCMSLRLRGIPTGEFIAWENVRPFAKSANWSKAHLTWNENGNNIDIAEGKDHSERWEGVINYGNDYFPQVGGPSCGPYNKRNEVDRNHSGRFRMYYSPVDQRLHLYGAEIGWIKVDYNYDNKPDMEIVMEDTDHDGFFDLWKYDVDGDGKFEREYRLKEDKTFLYEFDYQALRAVYVQTVAPAISENQKMIEALKSVLQKREKPFRIDAVENYFRDSLVRDYDLGFALGKKIKESRDGTRYYQDLIRERYWARLLKTGMDRSPCFGGIRDAFERGEYSRAAELLYSSMSSGNPGKTWYAPFKKRFAIELVNPTERRLESQPFILSIRGIREKVPDFNPFNFALVEPEPRIDWREIPAQADDTNGDNQPDELVFVRSVPAAGSEKLFCYYSPGGRRSIVFPKKADTAVSWDSPTSTNIGWESNLAAYRIYDGQMEAFGKLQEGLILAKLPVDYHHMQPWGMDVLQVGKASGLGGISLWEDGERISVQNPGGKGEIRIRNQVLASGPVRSLVRVDFDNIRSKAGSYRVSLRLSAFADNRFSRQEITIDAPASQPVAFSPGIEKLKGDAWTFDSGIGFLASWGFGEPEAGEIGLALMFDPKQYVGIAESALDRLVKLKIGSGQTVVYWVLGDWRKGLANPVAPTARDWARQVEDLVLQLRTPVQVRLTRE